MVYVPNIPWSDRATDPTQQPVYFITMDGVSFRISTGKVKGETFTYKRFMETPSGASQQIKPLKGQFSLGGLSLKLTDKDAEITNLMSPGQVVPTWINRE